MGWIFFLIMVLAMVWLALLLQRRRRDHREAEQAREMAFLLAHGEVPAKTPAGRRATPSPAPDAADRAPSGLAATESHQAAGSPAYLNPAQAAAFRRLAAALPDYLIFPRGSLRRAAGLATIERDVLLDFVICTPALQPVAAIDLEREGASSSADALKRETLRRAGVRYARWPRAVLPDVAAIAAWLAG